MPGLAGNDFRHHHAFFRGLVCQHGAAHHVAYRINIGQAAAAVIVDFNAPCRVQLQACLIGTQSFGIGHPAYRNNQFVGEQLLCGSLGIFPGNKYFFFILRDFFDLHAEMYLQSLFAKSAQRFLRHLIVRRRHKCWCRFQYRYLAAQPAPHAAQLQPDYPRTDNGKAFWHFGKR
jgi:hypothetical protein